METNEILDFLVNDAFPVYSSSEATNADKQIFKEILKSLPKEQLMDVNELLEYEFGVPWELTKYIGWLINEYVVSAPISRRNEPITTLIRWFLDKNSGKSSYAFKYLKHRYQYQSQQVQKQILKAFLSRTASSANWAGARLSDDWIPSLAPDLQSSWERREVAHKHRGLAWAVLKCLPKEYGVSQQDALIMDLGYGTVCSVLGNEPGFHIDETRLDVPSWFFVMSRLETKVALQTMWGKIKEYFRELDWENSRPFAEVNPSLGYMEDVGPIILPALRKMGATEILVQLAKMQNAAVLEAMKVDEASRMRVFKHKMRDMVLDDSLLSVEDFTTLQCNRSEIWV